jgi:hypothetical protein
VASFSGIVSPQLMDHQPKHLIIVVMTSLSSVDVCDSDGFITTVLTKCHLSDDLF